MKRVRTAVSGLMFAGLLLGPVVSLGAEELRPALNASLILNMLALPMENPGAAFRESLREAPDARAGDWEMQPDGSARFGNSKLHVIIKNPCPDGTYHAPVGLPGRPRR